MAFKLQKDFQEGRALWGQYLDINGYAWQPTSAGLRNLAASTGRKKTELSRLIYAFLEA